MLRALFIVLGILNVGLVCSQAKPTFRVTLIETASVKLIVSEIEHHVESDFVITVFGSDIPIIGETRLLEDTVLFFPDFPFQTGVDYVVSGGDWDTIVSLPTSKKEVAFVQGIHPTTARIPENLLRFYIYFSAPMREGNFLSHIHLYNEKGEDMKGVFFDNQYELWNADYTRLTVLVDPGRVKTGLKANREFGRAFKNGEHYRLVIDKNWKTIEGQSLQNDFVKTFYGVEADVKAPVLKNWVITIPEEHTLDPLIVDFGEPVDHRSVVQFLQILNYEGEVVQGSLDLSENESILKFSPNQKWNSGKHQVLINTRFEDIVGNNLNGLFDHPVGSLISEQEGMIQTIKFEIQDS